MKHTSIHYMGAKDCPFTLKGKKLTEYRRADLRGVAQTLKVSDEGSKNELLQRIVTKLKVIGAESEIGG